MDLLSVNTLEYKGTKSFKIVSYERARSVFSVFSDLLLTLLTTKVRYSCNSSLHVRLFV